MASLAYPRWAGARLLQGTHVGLAQTAFLEWMTYLILAGGLHPGSVITLVIGIGPGDDHVNPKLVKQARNRLYSSLLQK